jgi:hypothetical protein
MARASMSARFSWSRGLRPVVGELVHGARRALADVLASLRALSELTRGFVRAEQMLDPARAEPLGGCNRSDPQT